MALSFKEIKDRALAFSKERGAAHREEADAKPLNPKRQQCPTNKQQ